MRALSRIHQLHKRLHGVVVIASPPAPLGWEYRDISIAYDGSWEEDLNLLGLENWMVVSVIHDETPETKDREVRILMMRPRAAHPAAKKVKRGRGRPAESDEDQPKILKDALAKVDADLRGTDLDNDDDEEDSDG